MFCGKIKLREFSDQNMKNIDNMQNPNLLNQFFINRQDYLGKLKEIVARHRYVVFYGCGVIFPSVLGCWREFFDREIDFVCDISSEKWGKSFCGVKCISPAQLLEIEKDTAVFITLSNLPVIYPELKNKGVTNCYLFYDYDIRFGNMPEYNLPETMEKLQLVRDMVADDRSGEVLDTVLKRIFSGDSDPCLMSRIFEDRQYFVQDLISLSEKESFVDIGAYDGDTIKEFLKYSKGEFENIYALELCQSNFDKLAEYAAALPCAEKIHCINKGCWDSLQEVRYGEELSSSAIGKGAMIGIVDRLDTILANQPVTLIKMDIEGAEMNALRGAENIIRTRKPKMAICVYHDLRHFYEVPLYLKSLVPEYKIYFRHHTKSCYETVCYATI